jgi:tetratricopeptide (TPR) repeat protein
MSAEQRPPDGTQPAKAPTSAVPPLGPSSEETLSLPVPLKVDPPPACPQIPDYEILEEVGRGGMGVVYRARHMPLQRLVALKRMTALNADSMSRFRREAEAVAALQHPNIVQIYEIGEHEGQPHIALQFLPGGNLAQLIDGTPQPPREAARMVETLAQAMSAAHQRGVVHRDLKPLNILLTREGTPKISDFGLAKHLDADQEHTQAGDILGTPSYMAPEQAEGRIREIGPAADIYALGAILYEMLTGRPPFKGTNKLETLAQVRTQEPVPPRRLQPQTPRDLERICLQCLEKDPANRYATAAALAADLGRFLAGKPVHARPRARTRRLWHWVKEQPGRATGAVALILGLLLAAGAGAAWLWQEVERQRDEAEHQRAEAEHQRRQAEHQRQQVENQREQAEHNHREAEEKGRLLAQQKVVTEQALQREKAALLGLQKVRDELARVSRQVPPPAPAPGPKIAPIKPAHAPVLPPRESPAYWTHVLGLLAAPASPDLLATVSMSYRGDFHRVERSLKVKEASRCVQLAFEHSRQNREDQAAAAYRQAITLLENLLADQPDVVSFRQDLAVSCNNLAFLLSKKQPGAKEAEQLYWRSLAHWEELKNRDPASLHFRDQSSRVLSNLANIFAQQGNREGALAMWRRAVYELEGILHRDPKYKTAVRDLRNHYHNLAFFLVRHGDFREAHQIMQEALTLVPQDWQMSARLVCRFIPMARKAGDEAIARQYEDLVVKAVGQALDRGFTGYFELWFDPDFKPLKTCAAFRQLYRDRLSIDWDKVKIMQGTLSKSDPRDRDGAASRLPVHAVTLEAGKKYRINLLSKAFPGSVRIEDAAGKDLTARGKSGNDNTQSFFVPPATATYRLVVTSFRSDAAGPYILGLQEVPLGSGNMPRK